MYLVKLMDFDEAISMYLQSIPPDKTVDRDCILGISESTWARLPKDVYEIDKDVFDRETRNIPGNTILPVPYSIPKVCFKIICEEDYNV